MGQVSENPKYLSQLLSLPSSDLDVALSIPSGHSFAVAFVDHLKAQGVTTGSVGRVAINPEQSKHLETGTTRILGLECDFVGLRSETYADTRIPQVVSRALYLTDSSVPGARSKTPRGGTLRSTRSSTTSTRVRWRISLVAAWTIFAIR